MNRADKLLEIDLGLNMLEVGLGCDNVDFVNFGNSQSVFQVSTSPYLYTILCALHH